ncbi:MAG: phosphatase PAP2/dual specificity phosphatase family protein [Inhella sp.]
MKLGALQRRALLWLAFLGPFFYASYGLANHLASRRGAVPTLAFAWEAQIPFLAWTILPYWSLNLFYAASPFLFRRAQALDAHGRRLLLAQVLAVACFLIWPLRFGFERPAAEGWAGALFAALMSFDQPYNQAPSLHIALLLILWQPYAQRLQGLARWALHAWFALIGVSVLTTYQHHFIDIPAGAALGLLCMSLLPLEGRAPAAGAEQAGQLGRRLARRYALGAAAALAAGLGLVALGLRQPGPGAGALIGAAGLLLAWTALALAGVAWIYRGARGEGFQKRADGQFPIGPRLLLAPYRLGAWLNSRWHTRGGRARTEVWPGVWLSRHPSAAELRRARPGGLIDAPPELALRHGAAERLPLLDLLVPSPQQLRRGAEAIEAARPRGAVWVCCALGYSRSAAIVATWLLRSGAARNAAAAAQ